LTIDCSLLRKAGGLPFKPVASPSLLTASAEGLDDHTVLIERRGDKMPKVVRVQAEVRPGPCVGVTRQ